MNQANKPVSSVSKEKKNDFLEGITHFDWNDLLIIFATNNYSPASLFCVTVFDMLKSSIYSILQKQTTYIYSRR